MNFGGALLSWLLGIVIVCAAEVPVLATDSGAWLPLKRSDVVRLLAGDSSVDSVKVETLEELLSALRSGGADEREMTRLEARRVELRERLGVDEVVWVATNDALPLAIVMAGRNEDVHSLRMTLPVVSYSKEQEDRVFAVLSALFREIYPNWSEAADWPTKSLVEAWEMHPFSRKEPHKDLNDMIIRRTIGGVTSATFGVPPDIVAYTITTRNRCVPKIDQDSPLRQQDPFQRIIC